MIEYSFVTAADLQPTDYERFNELLRQLSADFTEQNEEHFKDVLLSDFVVIARDSEKDGMIIGMGCLVPIVKPIRKEARIEDVVVDEAYRGQGIGKAISQRLIDKARAEGVDLIELTSSPFREAANKLYQSLGFQPRTTNVYQMQLKNEE